MEVTKELFEKYYVEEDKTREEVAELFGIKPFHVSNYANMFNLKKLSAARKLEKLKLKYPLEKLKEVYDRVGYSGTIKELGIKSGDLDKLIREYQIGKRGKQARFEAGVNVDELRIYYLQENHSFKETAEHFNCIGSQLRLLLTKEGIVKDRKQVAKLAKRSCIEKYGVDNINLIPGVKEKRYQTNREKYGVDNIFQLGSVRANNAKAVATPEVRAKIAESRAEHRDEITEKIKATLVGKYGGVGLGSETIKKKVETTVKSRYGNEDIRKTDWFKQHYKDVCLERYGTEHPMRSEELQQKLVQTNQEKYGVNYFVLSDKYKHSPLNSSNSKPNLAFVELLTENGIKFEREFPLENKSYDFKVGNVLVEIDPFATHNSTWGIKGGEPKSTLYHLEKTEVARNSGYQCIHVWDWDDRDKIIKMFLPKERIFARKCTLKELTQRETNRFLDEFHLQGRAKMQTVCLGLYYGENLIQVMTFGKPRFNKHFEWELIRLCTRTGYMVVGGSDKLFKHFVQQYCPESIISYCDMSKFTGRVYTQLGMELKSCSNPSRHWYNPETGRQLTDNGVRMLGFDKLVGAAMGQVYGKGTSNDSLLREHGWVEIWDAGQAVYVWYEK